MHPTILTKRKAEAVAKLVSSAEALAETLSLDPELIKGLHPVVGSHDNQLREMLLLEGASNLITAVAIEAGAIKADALVTAVTPTEEAERATNENQVAPIDIAMGPDGLPASTLDEAPVEEVAPASKPSKASAKKTKGRQRA